MASISSRPRCVNQRPIDKYVFVNLLIIGSENDLLFFHSQTITQNCAYLLSTGPLGTSFDTLRPRQNGRHAVDDIFKCIFLNENIWILTKISLNYVPYGLMDNMAALVQIMAWRRPGDKPLSEPMLDKFGDAYMRLSASIS